MLTKKDIHIFLKNAGIKSHDTVLIHTSMRSIGGVENGCDGIIDGFKSYLSNGLFIVPTHTWANVNKEKPVFNVNITMPCIGALPCVAAFRPDGVRSLHPTHSVAAFGKDADEFVKGEEKSTTPCPPNGVWARLLDKKAKILLIGVGLNRNTFIHAIDELLELPDRFSKEIELTVIDKNQTKTKTLFHHHSKNTGSENFGNFKSALEYHGALKYQKLGNAEVGIFDTVIGTKVIKALWQKADYHLCKEPKEIPKEYYANI